MQFNPMLSFNGDCEAAFKFYEQCLGGKIQTMMTWGDSPMADQVPAEWHKRIIHVTLIAGEGALLGNDSPPDCYEKPSGLSVTIQIDGRLRHVCRSIRHTLDGQLWPTCVKRSCTRPPRAKIWPRVYADKRGSENERQKTTQPSGFRIPCHPS